MPFRAHFQENNNLNIFHQSLCDSSEERKGSTYSSEINVSRRTQSSMDYFQQTQAPTLFTGFIPSVQTRRLFPPITFFQQLQLFFTVSIVSINYHLHQFSSFLLLPFPFDTASVFCLVYFHSGFCYFLMVFLLFSSFPWCHFYCCFAVFVDF